MLGGPEQLAIGDSIVAKLRGLQPQPLVAVTTRVHNAGQLKIGTMSEYVEHKDGETALEKTRAC